MATTKENADKFRQVKEEKKITPMQFKRGLSSYAKKTTTRPRDAQVTAHNLNKLLDRPEMSDKTLIQGLAVLELAQ